MTGALSGLSALSGISLSGTPEAPIDPGGPPVNLLDLSDSANSQYLPVIF